MESDGQVWVLGTVGDLGLLDLEPSLRSPSLTNAHRFVVEGK